MTVTCARCGAEYREDDPAVRPAGDDRFCTVEAGCDDRMAALLDAVRCICGPDETGEAPDCRTDCPVHGADAPYDPASDVGELPF